MLKHTGSLEMLAHTGSREERKLTSCRHAALVAVARRWRPQAKALCVATLRSYVAEWQLVE